MCRTFCKWIFFDIFMWHFWKTKCSRSPTLSLSLCLSPGKTCSFYKKKLERRQRMFPLIATIFDIQWSWFLLRREINFWRTLIAVYHHLCHCCIWIYYSRRRLSNWAVLWLFLKQNLAVWNDLNFRC